jgi:hypothetical protein
MNSHSHTYPGRKCSRHHRFPALPQDGARAIISAHRCYLVGNRACLLASIIKPESLRSLTRELPQVDKKCCKVALKWSKSSSREVEDVTMCRKINIGAEIVKQDHAETDRVRKSRVVANDRRKCPRLLNSRPYRLRQTKARYFTGPCRIAAWVRVARFDTDDRNVRRRPVQSLIPFLIVTKRRQYFVIF